MDKNIKVAVLSDIHSNHVALKACVEYAINRGVKNFIFLGDYVSDCPYPERTMEIIYNLIKKHNCIMIRGNREDYILDYEKSKVKVWKIGSASGSLLYNFENLSKRDLDFFKTLRNQEVVAYDSYPKLTICHGSPRDTKELLYEGASNTKEVINMLETDYLLSGHTHIQFYKEYFGKKIINPGSVGVPMYHGGKAQFVILHGTVKGWSHEFIKLSYDIDQVISEFQESGLNDMAPSWARMVRQTLKTGADKSSEVLSRVVELCKGEYEWPDFPQEKWDQAIDEVWNEVQ